MKDCAKLQDDLKKLRDQLVFIDTNGNVMELDRVAISSDPALLIYLKPVK